MNVQARESVCHGKKLYRRSELIQHNFFRFSHSKFRHSNHRIGAQLRESHRTLRDGSFGVALSQALRARLRSVLLLRDALADLRESYRTLRDGSFEGRCPRHFVPGYDRCCSYGTRLQTCANHTVPYGTVLSGDTVPGTSCQATIAPSLRDISVTPIIESVRTPARITPYPTGRLFWGGASPGTSCQATIGVVPTGRACRHFATASG